jgi:hypothetical protein
MKQALHHPALGRLTFDAELNWYQGKFATGDKSAAFFLSLDECHDEDALFAMASRKIADSVTTIQRAREFSARELLELKNGEWLGDGEAPYTEASFAKKLSLESMVFYPDGTREFTFKDGGLFFGHVVLVSLDENDECVEASIAG